MQEFRKPEIRQENGHSTLVFYCESACGKEDGHAFRIVRLAGGMEINICVHLLTSGRLDDQRIQEFVNLVKLVYPPFGLVAEEAEKELLKLVG